MEGGILPKSLHFMHMCSLLVLETAKIQFNCLGCSTIYTLLEADKACHKIKSTCEEPNNTVSRAR